MLIALDTNVIQEVYLMRSPRFQILFDYAARTESKFLLSRMVLDELARTSWCPFACAKCSPACARCS